MHILWVWGYINIIKRHGLWVKIGVAPMASVDIIINRVKKQKKSNLLLLFTLFKLQEKLQDFLRFLCFPGKYYTLILVYLLLLYRKY